jgi:hypothetical protein
MRKDRFFARAKDDSGKSAKAVKVSGYAEGDIGVFKHKSKWIALWIPSGSGLCTGQSALWQALAIAKFTTKDPSFAEYLQKDAESQEYKDWMQSKHEQSDTP